MSAPPRVVRRRALARAGRVRGLRGACWLVAACETKLLLLEVGGAGVREVPRAVLDGKAPTQLALLLHVSPLLLGGPPLECADVFPSFVHTHEGADAMVYVWKHVRAPAELT